jgi:tetratricopeptide (TPR) repeat protein
MLGGWLHRDTCFVASKVMRGERRRVSRERQAFAMNEILDHSVATLAAVAPILDEAINQLDAEDRTAILLRFFEQRDLRSVGNAMESSEDAARMRVNRALEKLRLLLSHRGVTLSVLGLGTVLAADAVTAAPIGLATTVSNIAIASAAAGTGTTLSLLKYMTMTQLKVGIGALLMAGAVTTLVIQHQAQEKSRVENESLRSQITQLQSDKDSLAKRVALAKPMLQRPVPKVQAAAPPNVTPAENLQSTNFYLQLRKKGNVPKLTAEQVETYLKANGRNAASLLAAFRATDDPALLKEAMQQFPNNPQVEFTAAVSSGLSSQEQRQWLDALEKSSPDNALAYYLSANNYFNSGQSDQAVQELIAASGKPQLQDYTAENVENVKEAYLAAGYSPTDASAIALMQLPNQNLMGLRQLSDNMVNLASAYHQAGDTASAQSTLQMVVNLGQEYMGLGEETVITQLTGLNIERAAFAAMDPNSSYGSTGQTVQDQINALAQQRAAVMLLGQQFQSLQPTMSAQDWINYTDRVMVFGQQTAEQWVVSKYGQQ